MNEVIYSTFILSVASILVLAVFTYAPSGMEPVTDDGFYERSDIDVVIMLLGFLLIGTGGLAYHIFPYIVGA